MTSPDHMIPNVDVPEGESGNWSVSRFTVSDEEARFFNIRTAFSPGGARRCINPGTYTRLCRGNVVVMSDTPAEKWDHYEVVRRAHGDVLVHGLGLGMVLNALLLQDDVTSVTVVEISSDVIALCADHYREKFGDRFELIHDDALTWVPPKGRTWDFAWHDIWDDICLDNKPDMCKLHRRFGRRVNWQGSWGRQEMEATA